MSELHKAMAEAFVKIEGAVKDKENPHFRSKYADLGNVVEAIKPALASSGLWFTQVIHNTPGFASVETLIMHSSGEQFSCGITSVPILKNDAQGYGSALTYARRYGLSAAFGVAPEDDDGNKACEKPTEKRKSSMSIEEKQEKKPAKLNESELDELAHIVTVKMMSDSSLSCLIVEDEMSKFLYDWQEKTPLHPAIDNLMENNRVSLLSAFSRWQKEKKPA